MRSIFILGPNLMTCLLTCMMCSSCAPHTQHVILFQDDLKTLRRGPLSSDLGAHTEYHYLAQAAAQGSWAVSNDRGWWSLREIDQQRWISVYPTRRKTAGKAPQTCGLEKDQH